jgi:hypothetical protein
MTSQLNVDTIVDKAGSGGTNVKVANTSTYVSDGGAKTQNTVQSLVKLWACWVGTGTPAYQDSFNASSLTDSGTGDYAVVNTNNFASTNYSVTNTLQHTTSNSDCDAPASQTDGGLTTSTRCLAFNGGGLVDVVYYNTQMAGDLA